jgi:hypothetical protein
LKKEKRGSCTMQCKCRINKVRKSQDVRAQEKMTKLT